MHTHGQTNPLRRWPPMLWLLVEAARVRLGRDGR
jgi:hypothetical protein